MSEIKLPEPDIEAYETDGWDYYRVTGYTADQMRSAILEERERCAKIAEKQLPPTEEECPQHWKAYEVAWRVRQLVAKDIVSEIRSQ